METQILLSSLESYLELQQNKSRRMKLSSIIHTNCYGLLFLQNMLILRMLNGIGKFENLFSLGKMEHESNYCSVSSKEGLQIYQPICVATLIYRDEILDRRGLNEFPSQWWLVAGLSVRDRAKRSYIRRELGVEPLLLCVKGWQLKWFGHPNPMSPGCLPQEVSWMHPNVRRPQGTPRTLWRDDISHLAWECPSIHQEELENISGEKDIRTTLLSLLSP